MPTQVTIGKLYEAGITVTLPDGSQASFDTPGGRRLCDVTSEEGVTQIKKYEGGRTRTKRIKRESRWLTHPELLGVTVRRSQPKLPNESN